MRILAAALVSEGLLFILSVVLVWTLGIELTWGVSFSTALTGLLLAIAPLSLNLYLWKRTIASPHSVYARLSREIITPLCRQISIPTAISVAILSGWCEEYFFRGALPGVITRYTGPALSCVLSSFLFAAIHFIGSFKRFGGMLPLYTIMGMYMWFANHLTGSLFCAAVLHGSYNLAAILQVKFREHDTA